MSDLKVKRKPKAPPEEKPVDFEKEVKKTPTIRLNVNMPVELYRALKIKAAKEDTSISRLVIHWVDQHTKDSQK